MGLVRKNALVLNSRLTESQTFWILFFARNILKLLGKHKSLDQIATVIDLFNDKQIVDLLSSDAVDILFQDYDLVLIEQLANPPAYVEAAGEEEKRRRRDLKNLVLGKGAIP